MIKRAALSSCGVYRYNLLRRWSNRGLVNFIMLNPSTADVELDDPTIRRCIGFARDWGYGGIIVTNLFAYRSTDPRTMAQKCSENFPITGFDNELYVLDAFKRAAFHVAAWGTWGKLIGADGRMREYAASRNVLLYHLGVSKEGYPRHPLYLASSTEPEMLA